MYSSVMKKKRLILMLHLDYIITGAWEDITHYQG